MAESVPPFQGMTDMIQQTVEQTRKAMENNIELFQKSMTTSPWFVSSDLNKKIQNYMQKNIDAASEFFKKLSQAKDFSEFLQIQSDFMQAQWNSFNEQMKDLGETMKKGATGGIKELSS